MGTTHTVDTALGEHQQRTFSMKTRLSQMLSYHAEPFECVLSRKSSAGNFFVCLKYSKILTTLDPLGTHTFGDNAATDL